MIFARKIPEFYILIIARKIFFSRILGGHVPSLPPPSSTPMQCVNKKLRKLKISEINEFDISQSA